MDQTVLVKTKKHENPAVSEVNVQENVSDEDQPKKRTWTPAREEAWQKCLEGRKKYIETKKEVLEREHEEKSIKEKIRLELLKKKIREEIQNELELQDTSMPKTLKKSPDDETTSSPHSQDSDKVEVESIPKPSKEKKKAKKRIVIEESSESSSSEEEIVVRRKKKKPSKRRRHYSDSESDESTTKQKRRSKQPLQANVPPPAHHFSRFSFV